MFNTHSIRFEKILPEVTDRDSMNRTLTIFAE